MRATTPIDAPAWVHVRARRLLSVRTRAKAKSSLLGGNREPGESDVAGLCREIREELAAELDPMSFRFFALLGERADEFTAGRRVRMTCYTAEHTGEPAPVAEIEEAAWLGTRDALVCPPAGKRLLAGQGLVD